MEKVHFYTGVPLEKRENVLHDLTLKVEWISCKTPHLAIVNRCVRYTRFERKDVPWVFDEFYHAPLLIEISGNKLKQSSNRLKIVHALIFQKIIQFRQRRPIFTSEGVGEVVIRSAGRYDQVKIKPAESKAAYRCHL